MPEDIEKIVDDAFDDEMDTLEWDPPAEVWYVVGMDADEDPTEADLVVEALTTVSTKEPWYEQLMRELDK